MHRFDHDPRAVIDRLKRRDLSLKLIYATHHTTEEIVELIDCLLTYPNALTHIYFNWNRLSDEAGLKLARYIANSASIGYMNLFDNEFTEVTLLSIAEALRFNTSLRCLYIDKNKVMDRDRVDVAFVEALRFNPNRISDSVWWLYSTNNEFDRLESFATRHGPPSMLSQLDTYEAWMKK